MIEVCDRKCFECRFSDCINNTFSYDELSKKEDIEISREQKMARDRANRYSENHRIELRQKGREYYYSHRELMNERSKQWSKENPLRVSSRRKEARLKDPEKYRQKQREYKQRVREGFPHCNECEECVLVENTKNDGHTRVCCYDMRLIEKKVSTSPHWCIKRKEIKSENSKDR